MMRAMNRARPAAADMYAVFLILIYEYTQMSAVWQSIAVFRSWLLFNKKIVLNDICGKLCLDISDLPIKAIIINF